MSFSRRPLSVWKLRTRSLALGETTLLMGILNVTPDSFSEGAGAECAATKYAPEPEAAIERGLHLLDQGAAILDIGGESTRPGSHAATPAAVSADEEQQRVLPVIEGLLRERPQAVLSIDTYRASTAKAAIQSGCEIVNDVSGLLWDAEMGAACARMRCGLVLMHTRGRPDEWRSLAPPPPGTVLGLVEAGLRTSLQAAASAGVAPAHLVLDPGYGFGKAFDTNYELLSGQEHLLALGHPLLAGVSRKSFLGRTLAPLWQGNDAPMAARGTATVAAIVAAVLAGASIVRVHEPGPAREAISIADAVLAAGVRTPLAPTLQ
ncbi:MAG TPA: dihydropteroate synthase [Acidobacteriaceae bacterium]